MKERERRYASASEFAGTKMNDSRWRRRPCGRFQPKMFPMIGYRVRHRRMVWSPEAVAIVEPSGLVTLHPFAAVDGRRPDWVCVWSSLLKK